MGMLEGVQVESSLGPDKRPCLDKPLQGLWHGRGTSAASGWHWGGGTPVSPLRTPRPSHRGLQTGWTGMDGAGPGNPGLLPSKAGPWAGELKHLLQLHGVEVAESLWGRWLGLTLPLHSTGVTGVQEGPGLPSPQPLLPAGAGLGAVASDTSGSHGPWMLPRDGLGWVTRGTRISCTLQMICLPTVRTRSSCANSVRQPPAAHYSIRAPD